MQRKNTAHSVTLVPPTSKVERMAVHQRVAELAAYVVPFDERDCPEHMFLVTLTRDQLTSNANDSPIIWKITYALLNSIGGIPILKSTDRLTELEWDSWRQSCTEYMQRFMTEKIVASIHFKDLSSGMVMYIPKSRELMLYNVCISTRTQSGNMQNSDLNFLVDILNRKTKSHGHVQMCPSYCFDDEFPHGESQNREYKDWKVKSFEDIKCHITPGSKTRHQGAAKRFCRALLAMANESCGGEVLIGIAEDKQQGKLLIKGLQLQDADREAFEDKIDEVLKNDPVTGDPRVWREPGRFPEKYTHWRVRYHDVINTPGNERRVIARIQLNHYPGGVFETKPVAYDVDQDGYVTEIPFSTWRASIWKTSEASTVTTGIAEMRISSTRRGQYRMIDQSQAVTNIQEGAMSSHSEIRGDDGTSYVEAKDPDAMNAALKDRSGLSWTDDKLNWSEGIGDGEVEVEVTGDSFFVLNDPLNYLTPKDHIIQQHPDTITKIQEIEKFHASDKGFVIYAKSWMSHLLEKTTAPKEHTMDLLVFVQRGSIHELHLWAIGGIADDRKDDWAYAIRTSLSLKQQLMKSGYPSISVICHTLQGNNERHSSGHQQEINRYLVCSEENRSKEAKALVKRSLSKILLKKDSYITTATGDEALIKFTEEQATTLFTTEFCRITLIRGPPGSGKTILAQCIAKKYDPAEVAVICTTESFQKYIEFVLGCRTFLVLRGSDITKSITPEEIKNIKGLIFDDVHNLKSIIKEEWYKILKMLVLLQKNVYLFADPVIQVYKETNSMAALQDALNQIKTEFPMIPMSERQLTEVHRNSRKVTSFIKDAVSPAGACPGSVLIKAVHKKDGDDIEMTYKGDLRINGAQNGLVILIKTLMTKDAENRRFIYKAREIAVLIDGEEAYKDKIFFIEVLTKHLGCKVQGAKDFPREGVQVDIVDEYFGLDAAVIIHLNSRPTSITTQIRNAKYRSFIASRGIFRVIFLVEEPLNHQHYKQMNLDKPLMCNPAFIQHDNSSSENVADSVMATINALNLEAAVAEFIDTISQLPSTQGEAISQMPDAQRGIRKVLQEHYEMIEVVLCKLESFTAQAHLDQDNVKLRQYYILCRDDIIELLKAMLKVNTPDALVSYTWKIIFHLSAVLGNMSDILQSDGTDLGIGYVKKYPHSDDTVRSVLNILKFAAIESPRVLIEDGCIEIMRRFLDDENQEYSNIACCSLASILDHPNLDLSQEDKSAINDKMDLAIQTWTGDWPMTRKGFSDVKLWLTNEQWPALHRLAAWEIKCYAPLNARIIVKEVGWQTLSKCAYLDPSLKQRLSLIAFFQEKIKQMMHNTETDVEGPPADRENVFRDLGESVDNLRAKLEDFDHTYNVGVQGQLHLTEQDCKMLHTEMTPILKQLERVHKTKSLLKHCQELYSEQILSIIKYISTIGVSEDIIYETWKIALFMETALDDHTPFVDRGLVEWGVTCMQVYQHNEELVFDILCTLDYVSNTNPVALLGANTLEHLKQLLWDRRQKLSVHACLILARVLSAPDVAVSQHNITSITDIMRQAMSLWDMDIDICMELDSFTDVKSWLLNEELTALQQLAALGIYYYLRRDASRYIPLMERDIGVETLEELSSRPYLTSETRRVLQKILREHKSYTQKQFSRSESENTCRLM